VGKQDYGEKETYLEGNACVNEESITVRGGSMPEKVITTETWIPTGAIRRPISERCIISAVFSPGCPKKRVFLMRAVVKAFWQRSFHKKAIALKGLTSIIQVNMLRGEIFWT